MTSGIKTLGELAGLLGVAELSPEARGRVVRSVKSLAEAGPENVSFLENPKYLEALKVTKAGAVLVRPKQVGLVPEGCVALVVTRPYVALAQTLAWLHPVPPLVPGRAEGVVVHPTAKVAVSARLELGVVVEAGAEIGEGVWLGAHVVLGEGVKIGAGTRISAGCVLQKCVVGENCLFHPGVKVGQDGFGFAEQWGTDGQLELIKVPQVGGVRIGDRVEIGANSTVDCGALGGENGDTVLDDDVKLDNQVQIGHNVSIGRGARIVAQAGIAGSSVIGPGAVIGGQVGVAGHVKLAAQVQVAARSGVTKNLEPAGSVWAGFPAQPIGLWRRSVAAVALLTRRSKRGTHDDT